MCRPEGEGELLPFSPFKGEISRGWGFEKKRRNDESKTEEEPTG
jgi:hypothetical protein